MNYFYKILFLFFIGLFQNCQYPIYNAQTLETYNISASVTKANGFSSDSIFFYLMDTPGTFDTVSNSWNYNGLYINIYNRSDLSLNQVIDISSPMTTLNSGISQNLCEILEPMVYFQNYILFSGFYNNDCNQELNRELKFILYDISANNAQFISGLAEGFPGYNPDSGLIWSESYYNQELNQYSFNEVNENFIFQSVETVSISQIVYIDSEGVLCFINPTGSGEIENDVNRITRWTSATSGEILYSSSIVDYTVLPQIIPDGDYIWAVADDGAGTVEIVKLDPQGTLVSGCEGAQTAMTLPQTIQTYAQNFGPLFMALGWFGFRRRKKE